ncbi:MAG: metal ABC transporter ATP-binding protein [Candidatus Cloacimonetes bacterium]|nr:metal ABC transporter ATP-binding protein [Candidatus Cloacimonadota bacterium]
MKTEKDRTVISLKDVDFSYNGEPVLENITLEIDKNDFVAILGPNGAGKTTLIKLLLGFLKPSKGIISILRKSPIKARKYIGYVPQYSTFDKDYPICVIDIVKMNTLTANSFFPSYKKDVTDTAFSLLQKLEIQNLAYRNFHELSGGQKQRALIARALINDPEILLLDEPTASVDATMEKDIYDTLKILNAATTILLITHDVGFVSSYVNKICCLNRFASMHSAKELTGKSLFDIYSESSKFLQHHCNL